MSGIRFAAGATCAGILGLYFTDTRSSLNGLITMPAIRLLDAESAHKLTITLGKLGLLPRERTTDSSVLRTSLFGKELRNPIGIAAGYDKNAEIVDALFNMGFGFVEVGSVTPKPQPGNEKPRVFRLEEDLGVINRYGFNSDGHAVVRGRLVQRCRDLKKQEGRLLGVNLGKNKTSPAESNDDYVNGIMRLGDFGDYLVVNISSPNTPGLRNLQKKEMLERLVTDVVKARDSLDNKPPLLVKIAPDLSKEELHDIADIVLKCKVDGVIISNTTISRPKGLKSQTMYETGGLSGRPLKELSLKVVEEFYDRTQGKIPIIGCGGITSGQDAIDFMKAGASVVQIYSGLVYTGPILIQDIKHALEEECRKRGFKSVKDLVGIRNK
jgi:dihydroorotate dehydrogenase